MHNAHIDIPLKIKGVQSYSTLPISYGRKLNSSWDESSCTELLKCSPLSSLIISSDSLSSASIFSSEISAFTENLLSIFLLTIKKKFLVFQKKEL